MNSRSASFCVGLMGTTRCGWMPSVASTLLVLSQRSCTPLITYACTLCTCAPACTVPEHGKASAYSHHRKNVWQAAPSMKH